MRVLHYVGQGEDDRHLLVETIEGREQFSLLVTDELRLAARSDLPRLGSGSKPRESPISPRDIQVRVRAGESPEDIAAEADIPLEKVLRFASAVVQERIRITGEARNARARRNMPDGELIVFGEYVDSRFAAHGIEPTAVAWDSYRGEDAQWVITAGWQGGDLNRIARWTFVLAARTVSPIDETAADLLSDRPIRPVVHVVYDMPIANPSDSVTGPIPMPGLREQLFDQAAAASDNSENAMVLPLRGLPEAEAAASLARTRAAAHEETDEEHAERARIPSWDDILLGVRRKRD